MRKPSFRLLFLMAGNKKKPRKAWAQSRTCALPYRAYSYKSVRSVKSVGDYSYSCQLLICNWSWLNVQNASMKAEARRALVIRGMLWSMAPRRIL